MTNDLVNLLDRRRSRAEPVPDPMALVESVRAEARRRARRNRTAAAAAASSVLVGAVVVGSLIVASSGPGKASPSGQVGSPFTPSATTSHSRHSRPAPSTTPSPTARSSAARAARLILAPPAPAQAPISLGSVPAGWVYLRSAPGYTDYAPARSDAAEVIRVLAERRTPDSPGSPPRVTVRPVLGIRTTVQHYTDRCVPYYPCDLHSPPGATRVIQNYGDVHPQDRVDVVYVIPDGAGLTRAQILTMIEGTDVRDLAHPVG